MSSGRWNVCSAISHLWRFRGAAIASHLNAHLPTVHDVAIHLVHGILCVSLVVESHKGEPATFFSKAVPGDVNVAYFPVALEHGQQLLGSDAVGEVVHLQTHHPLNIGRAAIPEAVGIVGASVSAPATTAVAVSAPTPTPPSVAHPLSPHNNRPLVWRQTKHPKWLASQTYVGRSSRNFHKAA